MFDQNGLSLDQAPPIGVVLRFFLGGSVWGIAAGLWLAYFGNDAIVAAHPQALVLTHMLTLGVLFSFMFGALFQMLPVLAGVAIGLPMRLAIRTQYPMIIGTLFLLLGFGLGGGVYYLLALFFLLVGLIPALALMLSHLVRVSTHSGTSRGIQYAVLNGLILVALGVGLVGLRNGWWGGGEYYLSIRLSHMGYGLLGWIGLLVTSIAFQVVEMFYVTPPYPRTITRGLPVAISALLILGLVLGFVWEGGQNILMALAMLGLAIQGAVTLRRFSQRKRPLTDATVWFWRMGSGALVLSMIAGIAQMLGHMPAWVESLGVLLFLFFATSIVLAMVYKIVPFLVWFHLNAQGYFTAPMMHEVIHPKYAMANLWIHALALGVGIGSVAYPGAWHVAGFLFALSFLVVGIGIYRGWHRYLHVERNGERFSFDIPKT